MRVALFLNLIDPRWVSLSMERYGLELKKNLEKLEAVDLDLVTFQPQVPKLVTFLPTSYRYRFGRNFFYPVFAQRHEGQINHIVDHSFSQVAKFLNKERTVVTCHDLIPIKNLPDGSLVEKDSFSLEQFRKSISYLKEVRMVLADSFATKRDLIDLLGVAEEKVKVVYLGRNESFKETKDYSVLDRFRLPDKPLLLHVGHNMAYKNVEGIIETLHVLKEKRVPFCFVKVGPEFTETQQNLIKKYDLADDIKNLGFLSEKELIVLYSISDALLYPSLFEGFGLPVLEAMSCALPVVVSRNTSLVEITEKTGVLVDPSSPEDIAQAVYDLLKLKTADRQLLKNRVKAQAEKFNWQNCAQEVLSVYREIYEKN